MIKIDSGEYEKILHQSMRFSLNYLEIFFNSRINSEVIWCRILLMSPVQLMFLKLNGVLFLVSRTQSCNANHFRIRIASLTREKKDSI